jgi:hypothetical protein
MTDHQDINQLEVLPIEITSGDMKKVDMHMIIE